METMKPMPMAGFLASSLLFLIYLISLILAIAVPRETMFTMIAHGLRPILSICIFLGLRYILVTISNLNNFKIVINLIIILQILVFISIWVVKLISHSTAIAIPVTILGFIQGIVFIWFLIMIFSVKTNEVKEIPLLKYFFIVSIIFTLVGMTFSVIDANRFEHYIKLLKIISGLATILLTLFFYKSQRSDLLLAP